MALSFEDEIKGFLQHGFEQQPTVQERLAKGEYDVPQQEAFDFLGRLLNNHTRAIFRIAREIDELRAATGRG